MHVAERRLEEEEGTVPEMATVASLFSHRGISHTLIAVFRAGWHIWVELC